MIETIRGEYWIVDGQTHYADGDVGDINHEGYALDHLRRKIFDAVDIDPGDEYDWERLFPDIITGLGDLPGVYPDGPVSGSRHVCDLLLSRAHLLDLDCDDIRHAFGETREDVRFYMCRKYGWVVCHGNRFSVWHLTREIVTLIVCAVGDLLDEGRGTLIEETDAWLEIFVASTNHTHSALWRTLEREDFSELPLTRVEPALGPNAQVAALDREIEHPYYQLT